MQDIYELNILCSVIFTDNINIKNKINNYFYNILNFHTMKINQLKCKFILYIKYYVVLLDIKCSVFSRIIHFITFHINIFGNCFEQDVFYILYKVGTC